jgi:hypothetical protein
MSYEDSQHVAGSFSTLKPDNTLGVTLLVLCSGAPRRFDATQILTRSSCDCPAGAQTLLSSVTPNDVSDTAAAVTVAGDLPGAST